MEKVTRRGVYKDLSISPYKIETDYNDYPVIYRFSSQAKLDKFNKEYDAAESSCEKCLQRITHGPYDISIRDRLMKQWMHFHYKEFKQ